MKLAIVADDHFGVRSDSTLFADNLMVFYRDVFWPYIDEHQIKHIVHLGDLFDRRRYVTFVTAGKLRRHFVQPLLGREDIVAVMIVGNHDASMKNHLHVNGLKELLPSTSRIGIVTKPQEIKLGELSVLVLPWVCEANRKITQSYLQTSKARMVLGHLELAGFEMDRGRISEKGMSIVDFDRFELVLSGHYHHKSIKRNVVYVGSTREQTWADVNDPKGFHILDTDTLELKHIPNPHTVYKITKFGEQLTRTDIDRKIIKVVLPDGVAVSPLELENYVAHINELGPADVRVNPIRDNKTKKTSPEFSNNMLHLLIEAAETSIEEGAERGALKTVLSELYQEARALEA